MKKSQIKYIIKDMLEIDDWLPEVAPKALPILDICQSKLEVAFFLGALYRMHLIAQKSGNGMSILIDRARIGSYPSLWMHDPWPGYFIENPPRNTWSGPSGLAFIPQFQVGDITADFALATCADNDGRDWHKPYAIVEIDGYAVHKNRREKDEWRDKKFIQSGYKVFRLYEETDSPIGWFDQVIHDFYFGAESMARSLQQADEAEDEAKWDEAFAKTQGSLVEYAKEIAKGIAEGKSQPMDLDEL